jgi:hypothetical protein
MKIIKTFEGFVNAGQHDDLYYAKALLKTQFLGERSAEVVVSVKGEDIDKNRDRGIDMAIQDKTVEADVEIDSDYSVDISGDVREVSLHIKEYYDIKYDSSPDTDDTPGTSDADSVFSGREIVQIFVDGTEVTPDPELLGLINRANAA